MSVCALVFHYFLYAAEMKVKHPGFTEVKVTSIRANADIASHLRSWILCRNFISIVFAGGKHPALVLSFYLGTYSPLLLAKFLAFTRSLNVYGKPIGVAKKESCRGMVVAASVSNE